MQFKKLKFSGAQEPIPAQDFTSRVELILRGVENMDATAVLGKIADIDNIVFGEGDGPQSITMTEPFPLSNFRANAVNLLHAVEGLKVRVKGTIVSAVPFTSLAELLASYNAIIINSSINSAVLGGFIVLSLGESLSTADLKLNESNLSDGKLVVSINKLSGVIQ